MKKQFDAIFKNEKRKIVDTSKMDDDFYSCNTCGLFPDRKALKIHRCPNKPKRYSSVEDGGSDDVTLPKKRLKVSTMKKDEETSKPRDLDLINIPTNLKMEIIDGLRCSKCSLNSSKSGGRKWHLKGLLNHKKNTFPRHLPLSSSNDQFEVEELQFYNKIFPLMDSKFNLDEFFCFTEKTVIIDGESKLVYNDVPSDTTTAIVFMRCFGCEPPTLWNSKKELNNHIVSHADVATKKKQCKICSKVFKSTVFLRCHIITYHTDYIKSKKIGEIPISQDVFNKNITANSSILVESPQDQGIINEPSNFLCAGNDVVVPNSIDLPVLPLMKNREYEKLETGEEELKTCYEFVLKVAKYSDCQKIQKNLEKLRDENRAKIRLDTIAYFSVQTDCNICKSSLDPNCLENHVMVIQTILQKNKNDILKWVKCQPNEVSINEVPIPQDLFEDDGQIKDMRVLSVVGTFNKDPQTRLWNAQRKGWLNRTEGKITLKQKLIMGYVDNMIHNGDSEAQVM